LNKAGRKGLFPFLVAGQGGLPTTMAIVERFQQLGASGIEVGFPFTDPVADGPVIKNAFNEALLGGTTAHKIFEAFAAAKSRNTIPLIAMVSASIVYRIGIDTFIDLAADAGFSGLIIPDLSLEEAPVVKERADRRDLRMVMLVSPTSSVQRQERIATLATGFIYYMSVVGITGERTQLPADLGDNVRRLRTLAGKPVAVGFGIKTAEQVRQVCTGADGAIVGSAFVRRIGDAIAEQADPVDAAASYLSDLLAGVK